MTKRRTYQLILVVLLVGLAISCTKSEVRTRKLIKKGRWMVTQMDIGANQVTLLPKWDLPTSPEEKEFASATWSHYDGSSAVFIWRFDYYEGTFTFLIDPSVTQDSDEKAYLQCNNLSGSYNIITDKSKLFEFESEETSGYPGVSVFLQIQPN